MQPLEADNVLFRRLALFTIRVESAFCLSSTLPVLSSFICCFLPCQQANSALQLQTFGTSRPLSISVCLAAHLRSAFHNLSNNGHQSCNPGVSIRHCYLFQLQTYTPSQLIACAPCHALALYFDQKVYKIWNSCYLMRPQHDQGSLCLLV